MKPDELNDAMPFDHVIRVHPDGSVTDEPGVYAPELHDGETSSGWTLLNGYSGQYSYKGPVMHASEYIGGRMARDILAEPGVYVALVDMPGDDSEPSGWAVARLDNDETAPTGDPHIRRYLVTLRHDSGKYRLIVPATSAERAVRIACTAEGAPPSAVLSVSEVES